MPYARGSRFTRRAIRFAKRHWDILTSLSTIAIGLTLFPFGALLAYGAALSDAPSSRTSAYLMLGLTVMRIAPLSTYAGLIALVVCGARRIWLLQRPQGKQRSHS